MNAALKIFIIYAREDKAYKDDLLKSLKLLQNQGLIEPWHDSDIKPGYEWDKEIKAHLRAADLILPIISFDFFNSDYIHRVEIVEAFERYDRGEVVIIPIIADSCHWWDFPRMKDLQALPAEAKAIDDWTDRKKAMASIYEGVKGIIVDKRSAEEADRKRKSAEPFFELALNSTDLFEKLKYYTFAINVDPQYSEAYFNRGKVKNKLKQFDEAILDFDKSILINSEFAYAYFNRAFAEQDLGRFAKAIKSYDNFILLKPDDADAYFNRGLCKNNLGKYAEAIKDYDQSIWFNPSPIDIYNSRGVSKFNLGEYGEAIKDFDHAILLDADNAKFYFNRGNAKRNLNLNEEAIKDYNKSIRLNPDNSSAFNNRGAVKAEMHLLEEAKNDFQKALSIDPANESAIDNLKDLGLEMKQIS